jgi:acetyl-CoA carboxylase carboxyl transferase subunit beta
MKTLLFRKRLFKSQKGILSYSGPRPAHEDDRHYLTERHSCPSCHTHAEADVLERNLFVCSSCGHHFRISPRERIGFLLDPDSFREFDDRIESADPLEFPGYAGKISAERRKTGLSEAIVTGVGSINGRQTVIAVMSFDFIGGSMGSVVGEKIARALEYAGEERLPAIIYTSSGGARMHEGVFSLMQMAKVSAAAGLLEEKGSPLFIVQSDPTTGGVTASIASLGSVILAEPKALIGFSGRRVIEGTINQRLPVDFQTAEFQLEKGFVDAIVPRAEQRTTLSFLIDTHRNRTKGNSVSELMKRMREGGGE